MAPLYMLSNTVKSLYFPFFKNSYKGSYIAEKGMSLNNKGPNPA